MFFVSRILRSTTSHLSKTPELDVDHHDHLHSSAEVGNGFCFVGTTHQEFSIAGSWSEGLPLSTAKVAESDIVVAWLRFKFGRL